MKYVVEIVSFALATLFFLYAGFAPTLEGGPPNLAFLGLAACSILLAVVFWRKGGR